MDVDFEPNNALRTGESNDSNFNFNTQNFQQNSITGNSQAQSSFNSQIQFKNMETQNEMQEEFDDLMRQKLEHEALLNNMNSHQFLPGVSHEIANDRVTDLALVEFIQYSLDEAVHGIADTQNNYDAGAQWENFCYHEVYICWNLLWFAHNVDIEAYNVMMGFKNKLPNSGCDADCLRLALTRCQINQG